MKSRGYLSFVLQMTKFCIIVEYISILTVIAFLSSNYRIACFIGVNSCLANNESVWPCTFSVGEE